MELDDEIMKIQKSTRTLIPHLEPAHNFCRMKFQWYYRWHLWSGAKWAHYLFLLFFSFGIGLWGYNSIAPKPVKAATNHLYSISGTMNLDGFYYGTDDGPYTMSGMMGQGTITKSGSDWVLSEQSGLKMFTTTGDTPVGSWSSYWGTAPTFTLNGSDYVASGAGYSEVNGTYTDRGGYYMNSSNFVLQNYGQWQVMDPNGMYMLYYTNSANPQDGSWTANSPGSAPTVTRKSSLYVVSGAGISAANGNYVFDANMTGMNSNGIAYYYNASNSYWELGDANWTGTYSIYYNMGGPGTLGTYTNNSSSPLGTWVIAGSDSPAPTSVTVSGTGYLVAGAGNTNFNGQYDSVGPGQYMKTDYMGMLYQSGSDWYIQDPMTMTDVYKDANAATPDQGTWALAAAPAPTVTDGDPDGWTISGTVTYGGNGLSGVTVSVTGTSSATATTAANGTFTTTPLVPGTYNLAFSKTNYGFTPATISDISITNANVTGQDSTAVAANIISGTVAAGSDPMSGGTVIYDGAYTIRTFKSDDTLVVSEAAEAEVLLVAGGGGGGYFAGGGGAGGLLHESSHSFSAGSYPVTVGLGGAGNAQAGGGLPGESGENSVVDTLTAVGGGGGGSRTTSTWPYSGTAGSNGGSGGGGSASDGTTYGSGGSGTANQGNDGGDETSAYGWGGAGGGGAGAVGGNASGDTAGAGGDGLSTYSSLLTAANAGVDISGTRWIAGGGGGGARTDRGGSAKAGGKGGGGAGSISAQNGTDGTANTGGGGGGSGADSGSYAGGHGGSGIVIVRYLASSQAAGADVAFSASGQTTIHVTADGGGNYTSPPLLSGMTWTVTPTIEGLTFSPTSTDVALSGSDVPDTDFAVAEEPSYSISGTILDWSSTGISGVTVSDGTRSDDTDENGAYTITGVPDGTYTLTPTKTAYTFTPATLSATVSGADLTGKDFTAIPIPPTSWDYNTTITIDHTKVGTGGVADFPVLVTEANIPALFWSQVAADGKDIRIMNHDDTLLMNHELVSLDTGNKKMELWFKADGLSSDSDTVFKLYWGNTGAVAPPASWKQGVWSNGYAGVWHMNDVTTSTISDSSGNGNTGSKSGANTPVQADGLYGKSQQYTAGQTINVGSSDSLNLNAQDKTFEGMVYFPSVSDGIHQIISRYSNDSTVSYEWDYNNAEISYYDNVNGWVGAGNVLTTGWHFVSLTFSPSGNSMKFYIDGSDVAHPTVNGDPNATGAIDVGIGQRAHNSWGGSQTGAKFENFTASSTIRTQPWIQTEFNNQSSASTFYSVPAGGITISGTCKQYDESTNCGDSETVKVAINGSLDAATGTTSGGSWSISNVTQPSAGDTITVFVDGVADANEANAVTKYVSGDVSGIALYEKHLSIGSADNQTLSNTDISKYDNSVSSDEDIFFEVNTGTGDLTLPTGATQTDTDQKLYVLAGNAWRPNSGAGITSTTPNLVIPATATVNLDGTTLVLTGSGDPLSIAGTFTIGTSTVKFQGANATNVNALSYYNLYAADHTGTTFTAAGDITVSGVLTINAGAFSASSRTLHLTGSTTPFVVTGTFTPATSTISYEGTLATNVASTTYNNLYFNYADTTFTAAGDITVSSVLTVNTGIFDASSYTITLSGSGTPLVSSIASFHRSTSTVKYTGAAATNVAGVYYHNLYLDHSNTTFTAAANFVVYNVLTVNAGTFDASNKTITLAGSTGAPFVLNGSFTPSTSTISYTGNASGNTSVTSATYYNLYINQAVETYVAAGDITVSNVFTINAGTFDAADKTINLTGSGTPFVITPGATGAWLTGWGHRSTITIDHTKIGTGGVSDFPVLLTEANIPADFWSQVASDGKDIRVTDSNATTVLKNQVVSVDTTGHTMEVWFKAPSLSSDADSTFYLYWGNSSATMPSAADQQAVWSNGFAGVWHMNQASGNATDSTSNINDLTPSGSVTYSANGTVGKSMMLDGSSAYFTKTSPVGLDSATASWGTWTYLNSLSSVSTFIGRGPGGFSGGQIFATINTNGSINVDIPYVAGSVVTAPAGSITTLGWKKLTITRTSGGVWTIYVGATQVGQNTSASAPVLTGSLRLGANLYAGPSYANAYFDELRVGNGVAWTQPWVTTDYNSQNAPASFYSLGTATAPGGALTASTSTFKYTGSSATNIAGTTYNNLYLDHTSTTFTAAGDITVSSVFTNNAGTFNASNKTIHLTGSGTPFINTGTFTPSTSTISYEGTSATNVKGTTYYNLYINHTGTTFTEVGNNTVSNVLTVNAGTFNVGNTNLYLSGSGTPLVINGTFDPFTSNVRYTGSGPTTVAAASYYNLFFNQAGTTFTAAGDITVGSTLTITAGNFDASNKTIEIWGGGTPLVINDTFTSSTSTITYRGAGTPTITATTYYKLTFNGTGTYTAAGDIVANSDFTLTKGTFNADTHNIFCANMTASGSTTRVLQYGSGTWTVSGNWDSSGTNITETSGTSTVDLTGTGSVKALAVVSGVSYDFYNLKCAHNGQTTTLDTSIYVGNFLYVYSGGVLSSGHYLDLGKSDGDPLVNTGVTWSGGGFLKYYPNSDITIAGYNFGNMNVQYVGKTNNVTFTLSSGITTTGYISASGATSNKTTTLDTNGVNLSSNGLYAGLGGNNYGGVILLKSGSHTDAGDLRQSGTLSGNAIDFGTGSISVGGNINFAGIAVTPGTGTQVVTLNGSNTQTITSSNGTSIQEFNNLTSTNASASGVVFADSATVNGTFTDTTQSSKLTFHSGSTYDFDKVNIAGAANHPIILAPSSTTNWAFNPTTITAVTYVDVSKSTNTGASFCATYSTGSGNVGWLISSSAVCKPNAPTDAAIGNIDSTSFDATWTDNSSDETGFKVYISTNSNADCSLATYPDTPDYTAAAGATLQSVTGKSINTQYCAKIIAAGSGSDSDPAYSAPKYTLANTPSAPTVSGDYVLAYGYHFDVTINPNNNPEGTNYWIQYSANGTDYQDPVDMAWQTETTYNLFGKPWNTQYWFKIKAKNGDGTETSYSIAGADVTPPGPPTNRQVSNICSTTALASWAAASGANSYNFSYGTDTNATNLGTTSNITDTQHGLSDLVDVTTYYWKVSSTSDANGTGGWSAISNFATGACVAPIAPNDFNGTAASASQVNWSWSNVSGETGWKVEDTDHTDLHDLAADSTGWNETGLSANTSYTRHANVFNDYGSNDSNQKTVYTLANIPGAPTVSATASGIKIVINKNSNPDANTRYAIFNDTAGKYVKHADGTLQDDPDWQLYADWGGASGFINVGLSPNVSYTYKVKAENGDMITTDFSSTANVYSPANASISPTVNATSSSSLTIIINANSNPASTEFIIYNSAAGQYLKADGTLSAFATWQTREGWGGDSGIANIGLSSNTSYSYVVRARNGDGVLAAPSLAASKYTLANVPGAPDASAVSASAIKIFINQNSNPAGTRYAIYNETLGKYVKHADGSLQNDADWQTYSDWGGASGFTNSGLTAGTEYAYQMKAENNDGAETSMSALVHTITGYPSVQFAAATSQNSISSGSNNISINLSEISGTDASVDYAATGGTAVKDTDYTFTNGTASIAHGQNGVSVNLTLINNHLVGSNKTIVFTLSNPVNTSIGATSTLTFTIINDNPAPSGSFAIAQGSTTNSRDLSLNLTYGTATQVIASTNSDFSDSDYIGVASSIGLALPDVDAAYTICLKYKDQYGNESATYSQSITLDRAAPADPTALSAQAGNHTISLSWTNPSDSDLLKIKVYRGAAAGFDLGSANKTFEIYGGGATYVDPDATNNIDYYYKVTALDGVGNESGVSNEVTARADSDNPTTPGKPGVTETTQNINGNIVATARKLTFNWSASEDINSGLKNYIINIGSASGRNDVVSEAEIDAGTTSFAYEFGVDGTYFVRVSASDKMENISASSDEYIIAIDTTAPGRPEDAVMYDVSDRADNIFAAAIAWKSSTDAISGLKGYVVSKNGSALNVGPNGITGGIVSDPKTGYSFYLDLSQANLKTSYSIKAVDLAGNITPEVAATLADTDITRTTSQKAGDTTIILPDAIIGEGKLEISDIKVEPSGVISDKTQAKATWSTSVPATSQVEFGTSANYDRKTDIDTGLNSSHTVILPDLNPATTYHFRVISKDKRGNEIFSSDQTFTTGSKVKQKSILDLIAETLSNSFSRIWSSVRNLFSANHDMVYAADNAMSSLDTLFVSNISTPTKPSYALYWPKGKGNVSIQRSEDGGSFVTIGETDQNFYLDFSAKTNANYTYKVGELTGVSSDELSGKSVISAIKIESGAVSKDNASVIVTFKTDKLAKSQVLYGEGESLNLQTPLDEALNQSHTILIENLKPTRNYSFELKTIDKSGENVTTSAIQKFVAENAPTDMSLFEIIVKALQDALSGFDKWMRG